MMPLSQGGDSLAEHALAYGAQGLEVFPVSPADKAPLTEHGMKDATTDAHQIVTWWREHPDALIGCRIAPDVIVLDIDPRHGGHDTWQARQDHYGPIDPDRVHLSGRDDGGAHHWFKRPAGKLSAKGLHDFARANGTGHAAGQRSWVSGIDLLHHDHRYTILPPSPHPATGLPYKWRAVGEPGPMPPWLAHYVVAEAPKPAPSQGLRIADEDSIADWYSATTSWVDILGAAGWVLVAGDGDGDGSLWRHPNASAAHSASIRHGCLFVYSPNTDFEVTEDGSPKGLTRFRAWAELEHRGDLRTAAREAREMRSGPLTLPASPLGAPTPPRVTQPVPEETEEEPPSDWGRVDVVTVAREILSGVRQREMPSVVAVEGAMPLFYRGRVNQIHGASGDGKSWIGMWACVEAIKRGELVMFVDWEDNVDGIAARMLALGCTPDELELLDYRNPSSGLGSTLAFEGLAGCTDRPYTVIVIDSTGEAMAAGNVDGNVDAEVAAWFRNAKTMSRWPSTPAVILVDHIPKAADAPAGAIGSQRKTAAITGASYRSTQVKAFAQGRSGIMRLTVHKDRLGHRAKGVTACDIHMHAGEEGALGVLCRLSDAQAAEKKGEKFRPTILMERISRWLEDNPGAWSKNLIEKNVTGNVPHLRLGLDVLIEEGYVTETPGAKGLEFGSVTPFRAPSDDDFLSTSSTSSIPRPTSSQDEVPPPLGVPRPPRPRPTGGRGERDEVAGRQDDVKTALPRPDADDLTEELFGPQPKDPE